MFWERVPMKSFVNILYLYFHERVVKCGTVLNVFLTVLVFSLPFRYLNFYIYHIKGGRLQQQCLFAISKYVVFIQPLMERWNWWLVTRFLSVSLNSYVFTLCVEKQSQRLLSSLLVNKFNPHQENDRRSPDEGESSGEFPLVASTVASSLPLSVLGQSQLLHPPLSHLKDSRETVTSCTPQLNIRVTPQGSAKSC